MSAARRLFGKQSRKFARIELNHSSYPGRRRVSLLASSAAFISSYSVIAEMPGHWYFRLIHGVGWFGRQLELGERLLTAVKAHGVAGIWCLMRPELHKTTPLRN